MATPLQDVYDAFLSKIEADDWMLTEEENVVTEDWRMLLNAAIMQFRYPRVSLDYDKESAVFTDTLGNDEIQLLPLAKNTFQKFESTELITRNTRPFYNVY